MNNVVIVAGGKGTRMGVDLPKQFINVSGKPILMHTIEAFYDFDKTIRIIVVLPVLYQELWVNLCKEYEFEISHEIADGGDTRYESVKNALSLIQEGLVAVQDGVRPFPSKALIQKCFSAAAIHKAVIPVFEVIDSLREIIDEEQSIIVDRSRYRAVQTPQVFDCHLLKAAYRHPAEKQFTDDASVVEEIGHPIHLVEGERSNIKITTQFDLALAEVILKQ